MTVPSLMERLKAVPVAPVAPQTLSGATEKNAILRGENASVAPVAPVAPKKERGQSENQKSPSDWTPSPPAPDPGMARLLALADRYCTAIQASDKAWQDWRADIEATAPNDWQGLAQYLRGELAKLVPVAPAMPPKAVPTVPASTTWRDADKADQLHYWGCPQCLAVVRTGTGTRCATGQQLHDTYIEVAARERFIGAKPDPAQPLPKFHSAQPWNEADRAYQAHHWSCTTCKAAARSGHSERCTEGQHLYATYEQAFEAGKEPT